MKLDVSSQYINFGGNTQWDNVCKEINAIDQTVNMYLW